MLFQRHVYGMSVLGVTQQHSAAGVGRWWQEAAGAGSTWRFRSARVAGSGYGCARRVCRYLCVCGQVRYDHTSVIRWYGHMVFVVQQQLDACV